MKNSYQGKLRIVTVLRYIFKWFLIVVLLCVAGSGAILSLKIYRIARESMEMLSRDAIEKVTASESPVFYDDGFTPIGVFFQNIHRRAIKYNDIPRLFIKALLAAEDKDFFSHHGIDLKGLIRAAWVNLAAGRVVQGGSTITQQTAKNIFNRDARSFRSKFRELIQAWLLEKAYSKEEILEIYANQFFVTGLGKGLGVATNYFFDKEPKDLNLVEACFIAGSLKGPNRYNPFIKTSDVEKAEARRLAKMRKDYVLKNMASFNFITEEEYRRAKADEVPFKEGKITYSLNVILDFVRDQLESNYFETILAEKGIDNIATSGIKIYTSVNKEIQKAALSALRRHLPYLEISLNGIKGISTDSEANISLDINKITTEDKSFIVADILAVGNQAKEGSMKLYVDKEQFDLSGQSLEKAARAWVDWKYGPGVALDTKRIKAFLDQFGAGDKVVLRKELAETGQVVYSLAAVPDLEGAILAMQKGMIKAMVGGFQNRHFNRAVQARRQVGSIFKPILYVAALQLKWNILDELPNTSQAYRFQSTTYVPKPDHDVQSSPVSMAWAGVKSENLATVWLLYHLTDHLSPSEFYKVARIVGLTRREDETAEQYRVRMRDRYGIVINAVKAKESSFERIKQELMSDLMFSGDSKAVARLRELTPEELKPPDDSAGVSARPGFSALRFLNRAMKEKFARANALKDLSEPEELAQSLKFFLRELEQPFALCYSEGEYLNKDSMRALVPVSPDWWKENAEKIVMKDIIIEGALPSWLIDSLDEALTRDSDDASEPHDFRFFSRLRDFRTLVNLSYVTYLARAMGISTPLDPVLSFPLGPNAITLLETCLSYSTIMTGKKSVIRNGDETISLPIITKIEDRNGDIIWEYNSEKVRVISQMNSCLTSEVLRNVMTQGTGRKAGTEVAARIDGASDAPVILPTYGKTGTANRFTNSSFVGFIPGPSNEKRDLSLDDGYVIAAYVGYDDNRPMHSRHTSIYGSTGALPLWAETANGIANASWYRKSLQPADLAFGTPELLGECANQLKEVFVKRVSGLPLKLEESDAPKPDTVKIYWNTERLFEPLEELAQ